MFRRTLPAAFFAEQAQRLDLDVRAGVYTHQVTMFLMIHQRLNNGSLSEAVAQVTEGCLPADLLVPCARVRQDRISSNTGGYSQARTNLPKALVEAGMDEIIKQLKPLMSQPEADLPAPVALLDGSSFQMMAMPGLRRAYPPPKNQHGRAHWPAARMVVAHDLGTGLAMRPVWGPMSGSHAVSEQALAERVISQLSPGTIVVGDRNFGVFSVAYAADRQQHPVLLRLTQARALSLSAQHRLPRGEQVLLWRPSAWDRKAHPELPADASMTGRLVVCHVRGHRPLYLFTTLSLPPERLAEIYGLRWNIETDLRSLKQTVHLYLIAAQTVDMAEKELLAGVAAYNLTRAVMTLAAREHGLDVRDLSFARSLHLVRAFCSCLADPSVDLDHRWARLLRHLATCRLPKRTKRRSFPRTVWGRGYRFPRRKR